jgi:2-polyprenyl-6-methoxyphenol hydroxylase-like FAD-dependent oxidoreductase
MLRKSVIIGGSISGLLCAHVLSNYCDEVIIVEKDKLCSNSGIRKGVPQANHIHLLLVKGKEILLEFFPELEKALLKKGANKIDFLNDGKYLLPSGWAQRFESGVVTITCTRNLLEETIREQLAKVPKIKIKDETIIDSFELETSNKISLKTSNGHKITADLVVDCSGRNTKTPNWLEGIGFSKPKETRVDSFVGYATRKFVPPKNFDKYWKMLVILNNPVSNPRAGIIYPIENGKWLVGLSGIGKDYPAVDEEGFLDFAKSLESPELYESIKSASPDSDIFGYQIQGSRKYHYEEMQEWPDNLIVVGDAVSVFNPFYGQGITSASLGVNLLDNMLKKSKFNSDFAKKFQRKLSHVISLPWVLGTSEDLRWPTTIGRRPNWITRFIQYHAQKVLLLGPNSTLATKSFLQMMHMIKSPLIIFHPLILLQLATKSRK